MEALRVQAFKRGFQEERRHLVQELGNQQRRIYP